MSEKPKVLIVATHPVQYQVPWFRHLASSNYDYDFEVLYLTLPDAEQQGVGFGRSFEWDIPLLDGYNWHQLDKKFLSGDGNLDKFTSLKLTNTNKLLASLKPDAVLLTGWQSLALLQIFLACNRIGIPTLIRGDSNNLKPRRHITRLLHKLLLKRYDKLLAVGQANRRFYLENGVDESAVYFCPHFIDNKFFSEHAAIAKKNRTDLRQKWAIAEQAFCFCYVGKLNPKKRIMDVLRAFHATDNELNHLLIVGDGALMQQAQDYVATHKLNVSFTGFLNQSEICAAYAVSDCLVLASDYDETWGLVVNEAMASGIPAIVSNRCGCHQDLIINKQTGYVFEFANLKDITAKMNSIRNLNNKSYNQLCTKANYHVFNRYSIEAATKGFIEALNSCFKS